MITDPGPISMLRRVVATENHPPGFYALGWVLDRIGVPVVWDRTISVLAAMALSALVVVYASRLVPLWGAAFAGLVTALGWQFWRHGWELRPYAVFALACMLFVLALAWAAERPTSGRLALLAAAVAARTMTHFFFLFTLGAGLIWLALRKEDFRRLLVAIAIGLLPLVAWLPAFYKQFERRGIRNPDFSLRSTLESYGALFVRGDVNLVFALLVLCLVLAGVDSPREGLGGRATLRARGDRARPRRVARLARGAGHLHRQEPARCGAVRRGRDRRRARCASEAGRPRRRLRRRYADGTVYAYGASSGSSALGAAGGDVRVHGSSSLAQDAVRRHVGRQRQSRSTLEDRQRAAGRYDAPCVDHGRA